MEYHGKNMATQWEYTVVGIATNHNHKLDYTATLGDGHQSICTGFDIRIDPGDPI